MYARTDGEITDDLTDADLILRFKEGDDRALETLLRRYAADLFRFCCRLTPSREDAEDICQESLVRAMDRADSLQTGAAFRGWLFRIARNLSTDAFRSRKRLCRLPDDEYIPTRLHIAGPQEGLEASEERQNVMQALRKLAESHQTVLILRELEGLSYAEIARRLDISQSAVETLLFRARRRLREEYARKDSRLSGIAILAGVRGLAAQLAAPLAGGGSVAGKAAVTAALIGGTVVSAPHILSLPHSPTHHRPALTRRSTLPRAITHRAAGVTAAAPPRLPARPAQVLAPHQRTLPRPTQHQRPESRHPAPARRVHHAASRTLALRRQGWIGRVRRTPGRGRAAERPVLPSPAAVPSGRPAHAIVHRLPAAPTRSSAPVATSRTPARRQTAETVVRGRADREVVSAGRQSIVPRRAPRPARRSGRTRTAGVASSARRGRSIDRDGMAVRPQRHLHITSASLRSARPARAASGHARQSVAKSGPPVGAARQASAPAYPARRRGNMDSSGGPGRGASPPRGNSSGVRPPHPVVPPTPAQAGPSAGLTRPAPVAARRGPTRTQHPSAPGSQSPARSSPPPAYAPHNRVSAPPAAQPPAAPPATTPAVDPAPPATTSVVDPAPPETLQQAGSPSGTTPPASAPQAGLPPGQARPGQGKRP